MSSKILNFWFIAGLPEISIEHYLMNKKEPTNDKENLKPEILISYPLNNQYLKEAHADFVFPRGIEILYKEIGPKFFVTATTNDRGNRFYLFSLQIYQSYGDIFIPITFTLCSTIQNYDFFKTILIRLYEIIQISNDLKSYFPGNSSLENLDQENLNEILYNFRNCEIINFLFFLSHMIQPPPDTRLRFNFHHSNADLTFDSMHCLPRTDSSLQSLFDTLELSTIIRLWSALLTEKHIIILGDVALLYHICNGLLSLLFPFKWQHTYIPILPDSFPIDYLDAPTPYLLGIPVHRIDYKELCRLYPCNVICDLYTGKINNATIVSIPEHEENILMTKVRYLRNPRLFCMDQMYEESDIPLPDIIRDNFSRSIQYIFFRIFRNILKDFEKKFLKENIFEDEAFLDELQSEDSIEYWKEVLSTNAFENFVRGYTEIYDSNVETFNNITNIDNLEIEEKKNLNPFEIEMNMPNGVDYFLKKVEMKISQKSVSSPFAEKKESNKTIKSSQSADNEANSPRMQLNRSKDINNIAVVDSNCLGEDQNLILLKNLINDYNLVLSEITTRGILLKSLSKEVTDSNYSSVEFPKQKSSGNVFDQSKLNTYLLKRQSSKGNSNKNFHIYGKQGFLAFYNNLFDCLSAKEINEINFSNLLEEEIAALKEINGSIMKISRNSNEINSKVLEKENEQDSLIIKPTFSVYNEVPNKPIIVVNKSDSFQYYLAVAFILDTFANEDANINLIINLYVYSCFKDKWSFPCDIFKKFAESLSLRKINKLIDRLPPFDKIVDILKDLSAKKQLALERAEKRKIIQITQLGNDSNSMSPLKLPSSFKMTHSSKKIPLVNMNNDNLNTSTEKSKTIKFKNVKSPTPKRRDEHTHLKYYIDDHINSRRRDICIKKMKRTLNEISNLNDVENIRSAFTVSEDLATRMKSIIEEFSLNKFKNCITKDILIRIYESHEFQSVRLIANELRKVGLKFQHENEKAAFLLNIFNSLVLYSVIVNKHRPDNIFSWRKEFKTCFFEIGGFYLSLIDISCLILNSETFLSEPRNFNPNSEKLKSFMQGFAISKLESISFGMSIPISTSNVYKVFTQKNIENSLYENRRLFLSTYINFNKVNSVLLVPECYKLMIDQKSLDVSEFITKYYKYIPKLRNENLMSIKIKYEKVDWRLNFVV